MRIVAARMMSGLGVALLLTACGPDSGEVARISEEQKMSKVQSDAFMICARNFYRNRPIFTTDKGNLQMTEVPLEVCACQSRSIVSIFLEDQMKGHVAFAVYMASDPKKRAKITKGMLQGGMRPPEAIERLTSSFTACVEDYKVAHPDEVAGLFELLPEKKKKEKKKKDEHKDGEKTASAS